jgi:hypothetical protein
MEGRAGIECMEYRVGVTVQRRLETQAGNRDDAKRGQQRTMHQVSELDGIKKEVRVREYLLIDVHSLK